MAVLAVLLGFARSSHAADRAALTERAASADPRTAAEATYDLAADDDDALRFAAALAGYERSIAILPSHAHAQRAATRIDFLHAHAEGDFGPLTTLEAVRRTPGATKDAARVDALAAAARGFPPGAVRGEAFFVVGEAYLTELGRPDDAEGAFVATLDEPAVAPVLRDQAAARLVERALARGDLDRATTFAARAHDDTLTKRIATARRRAALHRASLALLGVFAVGALVAIARRRGRVAAVRRFVPWALAIAAYVAGIGGLLATTYERGNAVPFLAFGIVLVPLVVLARAWAIASGAGGARRFGRAVLSAGAVFAAAFLLLERIDPRYLDGFGL